MEPQGLTKAKRVLHLCDTPTALLLALLALPTKHEIALLGQGCSSVIDSCLACARPWVPSPALFASCKKSKKEERKEGKEGGREGEKRPRHKEIRLLILSLT
jgi:hypothetical protein